MTTMPGTTARPIGEQSGHPDDMWGFAGQLALSIKNIPTGPGDTINVQGVYTDGATRYNIQDLAGSAGANTIYGGTSLPGSLRSVGIGFAPDTVFAAGTSQQMVQTWGIRGGTPTTGIPTGTAASTVLTLLSCTTTHPRP